MERNNIINDTLNKVVLYRSLFTFNEKIKLHNKKLTLLYLKYSHGNENKAFTTFTIDSLSELSQSVFDELGIKIAKFNSYEDIIEGRNKGDDNISIKIYEFAKDNVKKYNEIVYNKRKDKETGSELTETKEMIIQEEKEIYESSNELYSETFPIILTEFIEKVNDDKYYVIDMNNEIDLSEINNDIKLQLSKKTNKIKYHSFHISPITKQKSLCSSISSISMLREKKYNNMNTLTLRNEKVKINNEKHLKALKEIFSFYTNQRILLGKTPTFDSINFFVNHMDISEYLRFCLEFRISLNKKFLAQLFNITSKYNKEIYFGQFLSLLMKIAIEVEHTKNEKSTKTKYECLNDLINFMGINNDEYRNKMKGFIKPFNIYENKICRIPQLQLNIYRDVTKLKSHCKLSKSLVLKYKEEKKEESLLNQSIKEINSKSYLDELKKRNQLFSMKLNDKVKYEKYIKLKNKLNNINANKNTTNDNDLKVSWNTLKKSEYSSFILNDEDRKLNLLFEDENDNENDNLRKMLENKTTQRSRIINKILYNNKN